MIPDGALVVGRRERRADFPQKPYGMLLNNPLRVVLLHTDDSYEIVEVLSVIKTAAFDPESPGMRKLRQRRQEHGLPEELEKEEGTDNSGNNVLQALKKGAHPRIYQALCNHHRGDEGAILDSLNRNTISHLGGVTWAEAIRFGQPASVEAAMDKLGYFPA